MRINLNVHYDDRKIVKALGASWDFKTKVWYIEDGPDIDKFERWLPVDQNAGKTEPRDVPLADLMKPEEPKRDWRS